MKRILQKEDLESAERRALRASRVSFQQDPDGRGMVYPSERQRTSVRFSSRTRIQSWLNSFPKTF